MCRFTCFPLKFYQQFFILGFLEGESTQRVEKRYLGSCSVPFTTLFHEGRIEGVFRMDTPTLNFGYDHTSSFAARRKVDEGTMFVQVLFGMYRFSIQTLIVRFMFCVSYIFHRTRIPTVLPQVDAEGQTTAFRSQVCSAA